MIKNLLRKFKYCLEKLIWKIEYFFSNGVYTDTYEHALNELSEFHPMPKSSAICEHSVLCPEYDLKIIVPAYNAEKWIRQCIDSILNQDTQYSYKLIVVDDGSTDNTGKIIDDYSDNEKINIIHQDNKGYSGARNIALKELESEYIMFVDSDDYIVNGAIEKLINTAKKENADIVEANGFTFDDNGRIGVIKENNSRLWGGPCLKIMRSKLWENIEFPEGYIYEDTIINSLISPLAKNIICIADELYAYRIHSNSITQTHNSKPNNIDSFWIMLLMEQDKCKLEIATKSYEDFLRVIRHIVITYRRTKLLSKNIKKDIFVLTQKFLEQNYSDCLKKNSVCEKITKAIVNGKFKRYCLLCEKVNPKLIYAREEDK